MAQVLGGLQRGDGLLALAGVVTTVDADARAATGVGHAVADAVQAVLGAGLVVLLLGVRGGQDVQLGAHRRGGQCQQGAHAGAFHLDLQLRKGQRAVQDRPAVERSRCSRLKLYNTHIHTNLQQVIHKKRSPRRANAWGKLIEGATACST